MSTPSDRRAIIIRVTLKLKSVPLSISLFINSIIIPRAWVAILVIERLICKKCMQYAINTPTRMRAIIGGYQQRLMQLVAFLASVTRAAYYYLFFAKEGIGIAHFQHSFEHRRLLSKLIDLFRSHIATIS